MTWPPSEILSTDINIIFMALEGKHNLLREVGSLYFGLKISKSPTDKDTSDWFKSFAAAHNEAWKVKHE